MQNGRSEPPTVSTDEASGNSPQVTVDVTALKALGTCLSRIGSLLQDLKTSTEPPTPKISAAGLRTAEEGNSSDEEESVVANSDQSFTRDGRAISLRLSQDHSKDAAASSNESKKAARAANSGKYAFTHTQYLTRGKYVRSTIEFHDHSPPGKQLCNLIGDVRAELRPTYYRANRSDLQPLLFSPFEDLVWNYDRLKEKADTITKQEEDSGCVERKGDEMRYSDETLKDLRLLLRYVVEDPSLASYFETKRNRPKQIAWKYLWTLFPVGEEVVARPFLDIPQIFGIPFTQTEAECIISSKLRKGEFWCSTCWCYDYDGRNWVRAYHSIMIKKFDNEKSIEELPCYPIRFAKNAEKLKQQCKISGRQFVDLCNSKTPIRLAYNDQAMLNTENRHSSVFSSDSLNHIEYVLTDALMKDDPIYLNSVSSRILNLSSSKVEDEIIADPELWKSSYGYLHIGSSMPRTLLQTIDDAEDDFITPTPEEDTMLQFCPPRFLGCLPKDRALAQFKVSTFTTDNQVKRNTYLFDEILQIDENTKKLLFSQVEQSTNDPEQSIDPVKGKGNSLVILLHGPPGTGKTFTAESLAKATNKPLLVASVADIGLTAEYAESRLSRIFSVASRWQALLLIDEADAFLEERAADALAQRNAMVTIMLRALEYHSGTVILTTNRLASLDKAVQSRIQLAIRYPELSRKRCTELFNKFLYRCVELYGIRMSESDKEKLVEWWMEDGDFDQDDNAKLLNGREIRNVVSAAAALVRHNGRDRITKEDIRSVLKTTQSFKKQVADQMLIWKTINKAS